MSLEGTASHDGTSNIEARYKALGYTRKSFAAEAGVHRDTIKKAEEGGIILADKQRLIELGLKKIELKHALDRALSWSANGRDVPATTMESLRELLTRIEAERVLLLKRGMTLPSEAPASIAPTVRADSGGKGFMPEEREELAEIARLLSVTMAEVVERLERLSRPSTSG